MKKLLFLTFTILLSAMTANAATISLECQLFPATFDDGAGTSPVSCPGYSPANPLDALTSVSLTYLSDYQFGEPTLNTVQVTYTPQGPTLNWNPAVEITTVTGQISSGAPGTGSADYTGAVSNAGFANPFTVNVSSSVLAGSAATSSGAVRVNYAFESTIPEPSTLALLGTALAAVGLLRRRRKS